MIIADFFLILSSGTDIDSLRRALSQSDAPLGPTQRPICPQMLESPLLFSQCQEKQVVLRRSPGEVLLTAEDLNLFKN